ncbi:uncharacterized protein LOC143215662 [Lasioglossum baleicum]|uniref:uncharacterized protein LOC143215662 n=1 Tax=Lasioglossum baleicum TaxID=434251 RepID=UPI003FCCD5E8
MTNTMGGANLHTPPSIFQHMMGQQSMSQQPGPWMHMPQVPPMSMPWSMHSLQQPKLVRFTGGTTFEPILHQKRKLALSDIVDTRQTKQFITEEKMAAHFKDLHISPNYQSQSPTTSTVVTDAQVSSPGELNMDLEVGATNLDADPTKSGQPKLVLSEEIKRLQPDPVIPPSLLSKLERPSMALVLWEPPSKHLRLLPSRVTSPPVPSASDSNNNSNSNNNNNEAIPNLNETMQSSNSPAFEPMEL